MRSEETVIAYCPYCNGELALHIDCCELDQEYQEDCQHCCQPIIVTTGSNSRGEVVVSVRTESD